MDRMRHLTTLTAMAAALVGLPLSAGAQTPAPARVPIPPTRTAPAPEHASPFAPHAGPTWSADMFHLSDQLQDVAAATAQVREKLDASREAIESSRHALESYRDSFDVVISLDDPFFRAINQPLNLDFVYTDLQRAVPAPAPAPTAPRPPGPPPAAPMPIDASRAVYFEQVNSADSLYEQSRSAINNGRFERALDLLNRLIQQSDGKATAVADRVDAAMYWKAYTQMKMQATSEALTTLQDLQRKYTESRWIKDAKALEVEVRQASGQRVSPDAQADEELKLLALRGVMNSDPDTAIPMIAQLMAGNSSVTVKENALFVLSQSRAPRARDIIVEAAKSNSNPDVQLRAVRYLGMARAADNRPVLNDIYRSTNDPAIKRAVISAYAQSDAADALSELARSEKDPALKRSIIRSLGNMNRTKTGDTLKSLYAADGNADVRKDIINALSNQRQDVVLVELARAEKDLALKKQMVTALSNMKTKAATDYMLELLK